MALLEQLDIRFVPRYIRSEFNPADFFSRLTDRDAWTLSPSVQRMLIQRAQVMFRKGISLDAFVCQQSKVTSRFVSRHFAPEALAEDGLLLEWKRRSRLTESVLGFVARRHLQVPQGASSSCAYCTNVAFPNVVTISSLPRSVSCRSATAKVQCLASAHRINRVLPKHGCPSSSTLLSSWQQTLMRRAFSKWIRFVDFCTLILPSEYGMLPPKPLPASVSTVLFYLSHLSQEGEVREGSLNPYVVAVNQMHQDAGFRRPALGHYVDLLLRSSILQML
jgi:hypothetical protein